MAFVKMKRCKCGKSFMINNLKCNSCNDIVNDMCIHCHNKLHCNININRSLIRMRAGAYLSMFVLAIGGWIYVYNILRGFI